MTLPIADLTLSPITAGKTAFYEFQLQDETGAGIPAASLTTLTLTIVDTITKAVVNSCQDVNILNTGRGTVDTSGNVVVTLTAADTALLVSTHTREFRSLCLLWTYASGAKSGGHEAQIMLIPLSGS